MPHRGIDLPRGNNPSLPLPALGSKVKTLQTPGPRCFVTARHNLSAPSRNSSTEEWGARLPTSSRSARLSTVQTLRPFYLAKRGEREIYFDSPHQSSLNKHSPLFKIWVLNCVARSRLIAASTKKKKNLRAYFTLTLFPLELSSLCYTNSFEFFELVLHSIIYWCTIFNYITHIHSPTALLMKVFLIKWLSA